MKSSHAIKPSKIYIHKNDSTSQKKQKNYLKQRLLLYLLFFLLIALVILFSHLHYQRQLIELTAQKNEKIAKLHSLQKEERHLRREIEYLNNTEYIEKLARRDYYLSREDEILFIFKD